jgi:hypothetical protein
VTVKGCIETDRGLKNILRELKALKGLSVKVGVVKGAGKGKNGVLIARYAAWNEFGTSDGRIPPRHFIRGWIDNNREQIGKAIEKLCGLMEDGKIDAMSAVNQLGEYGQSGVKLYIRDGGFIPNSAAVKRRKKGGRPLIDTSALRGSVGYQVIEKPTGGGSEE